MVHCVAKEMEVQVVGLTPVSEDEIHSPLLVLMNVAKFLGFATIIDTF